MTQAPRAWRFPVAMRILWRPRGAVDWFEETSINTSRSGVLFRSHRQCDMGTEIELLLTMGHEDVAATSVADVLCAGRIVRAEACPVASDGTAIAATIDSYEFLHEA